MSFSWDSANQQEHVMLAAWRQDAVLVGQQAERAGFKPQLPPFIIYVP